MRFSELKRVIDPQRYEEIGFLDMGNESYFEDADLSRPQYDSRKVEPGDTFFAIRGLTTDGHVFIASAIDHGAKVIVLDDPQRFSEEDARIANVRRVVVRDSRKALAVLSAIYFRDPSRTIRMIGVTGTNGKTTVTNVLKQILEARCERTGLIGTIGIFIGDESVEATHTTPESRDLSEILAKMVQAGVTTCVMEVSSHSLALDRVYAIDYSIAVFTNLTQDHLDFHHTMEDYFRAKQILFNRLRDTAVAVTNADDPYGERMIEETVATAHRYGRVSSGASPLDQHADLYATNLELGLDGTRFVVRKRYSEEMATFETRLVGEFNVENLLAAISALYFGMEGYSLESLAGDVQNVQPVRGRFESVSLSNGRTAIIDYAHTPDAMQNVLSTVRRLTTGRVIAVFGCGGDRDRAKRPQMGRIACELSDLVIVTSDNPRTEDPGAIIGEIMEGIPVERRGAVHVEPDRSAAIRMAIESAGAGDAIAILGKGHETYQIVGTQKHHFDDREQVLRFEKT
jgi:UDP-N-acetylmuramoyl-L-alanyl-D-glutamate--2,6-diaminopimelate ligase